MPQLQEKAEKLAAASARAQAGLKAKPSQTAAARKKRAQRAKKAKPRRLFEATDADKKKKVR